MTIATGDIIRATKSFSFAWPTPDSAHRVEINQGDEFKVENILPQGVLRILVNGERVHIKPKRFVKVGG